MLIVLYAKEGEKVETAERKKLKITGMYCVQCEKRITKALESLEGVSEVRVSYKRASAELLCDKSVDRNELIRAVESEGYGVKGRSDKGCVKAAVSLAAIVLLYFLLQYFGLLNLLAPSQLAQSGMGYGALFGTVGYFGGSALLPITVQGVIKLAAGVLLVIMGLRLLGISSRLQRLSISLPKRLVRSAGRASRGAAPFIVGLLNGIMPCGPLQAMWLIALASGSPLKGAAAMLVFSLGTVPLMLGLGTLVSVLGKKFTNAVQSAGAVVISVMGLALFTQGGILSGMLPVSLAAGSSERDIAVNVGGVQIVQSELKPGSYPEITVMKGIPVRWVIQAEKKSINGCNYQIVCRELDFTYEFHEGENVIEFTPEGSADIDYCCWMAMIYGKIHVTDKL